MKLIVNYILFLLFFNVSFSYSEVLFEDSFNNTSDWAPTQNLGGGVGPTVSSDGDATTRCTGCPSDGPVYAGFRVDASAWSDYVGNTMGISSANAYGGTGKALTFWYEPINSSLCDGGTGWCSDQMVVVSLPSNQNEIYLRYRIKFQTGWVWENVDPGTQMKFGHITHFDGTTNGMFTFFKQGYHWPIAIPVIFESPSSGSMIGIAPRKQSCYYPNEGYDTLGYSDYARTAVTTWNSGLADGNWHILQWHVKGNSGEGVADGVMEVYIDGNLAHSSTNIPWADRGLDASGTSCCTDVNSSLAVCPPDNFVGWNTVMIGGNQQNKYYSSTTHTEQWYAIDDLVISTTYVSNDYVIGVGNTASSISIGSGNGQVSVSGASSIEFN